MKKINILFLIAAFFCSAITAAAYEFVVEDLKKIPFDYQRFENITDNINGLPTVAVVVNTTLRGISFAINDNNVEDIQKITYTDDGYILYLPATAFTLSFRGKDFRAATIFVKGSRAWELTLVEKGVNTKAFNGQLIINYFVREPFDPSSRLNADGYPVLRINTDLPLSRIFTEAFRQGASFEYLRNNDAMAPYYLIFEIGTDLSNILNNTILYKESDGDLESFSNSPLRNIELKENGTYYIDIGDYNSDAKRPKHDLESIKRFINKFKKERSF